MNPRRSNASHGEQSLLGWLLLWLLGVPLPILLLLLLLRVRTGP